MVKTKKYEKTSSSEKDWSNGYKIKNRLENELYSDKKYPISKTNWFRILKNIQKNTNKRTNEKSSLYSRRSNKHTSIIIK